MKNNLYILDDVDLAGFSNVGQNAIEFVCGDIADLRRCDADFISRLDNKLLMRVLGTDTYFLRRDSKLKGIFRQMEYLECDLGETEEGRMAVIR